ncbi:TetR/AcrR family transcriptional regulator [Modestobacter sp. NPDC049651]|uniref:TetR/AcrR family transcriptional regulator n=1 Tax=unclassified Modestobacter TaxID=2643866 RepID=UPI0033C65BF9
MPTARERARAELTAEITELARAQLATVGAAGLSLRAVARELGMVSSAVYRYFPSRDDLLTRLIIDGYDALGSAAEAADDPDAEPLARWAAVCTAVRGWARAHPHEYALLYGSPVPGYRAPRDTVPAAMRVGSALGRILAAAADAGLVAPGEPAAPAAALVTPEVAPVLAPGRTDVDERTQARAVLAWSGLFGLVSFELFGHLTGAVADPDAFFDAAARDLAGLVGLRPAR